MTTNISSLKRVLWRWRWPWGVCIVEVWFWWDEVNSGDRMEKYLQQSKGVKREMFYFSLNAAWQPPCCEQAFPGSICPCVVLKIILGRRRLFLYLTFLQGWFNTWLSQSTPSNTTLFCWFISGYYCNLGFVPYNSFHKVLEMLQNTNEQNTTYHSMCLSGRAEFTEKPLRTLVHTCVSLTVYVFITAERSHSESPLTGVAIPPVLGVGGSNLQP